MSNEDTAIAVRDSEWDDIRAEVDSAIEISLLSGKPDAAMELGREVIRKGRLAGVKLARLLYEIDQVWDSFQTDDSVEAAVERDIGVAKDTFIKYSRMYRYVLLERDTTGTVVRERAELSGKPIEGLIKLTAGARDGDFTKDHWRQIVLAPNVRAMLEVRDAARGIQTSGHNRLSAWATPSGRLRLKRGSNGEQKSWGMVPVASDDEDIAEMVERLGRIGVIFQ